MTNVHVTIQLLSLNCETTRNLQGNLLKKLYMGEGLTSFNNDNSANVSGEKKNRVE